MSKRRPCPYCGWPTTSVACQQHRDLPVIEATERGDGSRGCDSRWAHYQPEPTPIGGQDVRTAGAIREANLAELKARNPQTVRRVSVHVKRLV